MIADMGVRAFARKHARKLLVAAFVYALVIVAFALALNTYRYGSPFPP